MTFKGHSRSSQMSRSDRSHVISYYRPTVTMALSSIVSDIKPNIGQSFEIYIPHLYSTQGGDPVIISQRCLVLEI